MTLLALSTEIVLFLNDCSFFGAGQKGKVPAPESASDGKSHDQATYGGYYEVDISSLHSSTLFLRNLDHPYVDTIPGQSPLLGCCHSLQPQWLRLDH
jgi:hypothetical protein